MLKLISYLRISTKRQGRSGLGEDAQRVAVGNYALAHDGVILGEFVEIESGKKSDRPKLKEAIQDCKECGATLIVAKLDRLARDAKMLLTLVDGGVPVVFCDFPEINTADPITGRLILTMLAAVAEFEGRRISQRTREGLQARKRKGLPMGAQITGVRFTKDDNSRGGKRSSEVRREKRNDFYSGLRPRILAMRESMTLEQIAEKLNSEGRLDRKGKPWTRFRVSRAVKL
jgi:DNA invertase Pin-like site-specific DNA recombinase